MEFSRNLKIGALVFSGIAFAFLAGYVIFSYFSKDKISRPQTPQVTSQTPVEVDSQGIEPNGSVAGAYDSNDSSGISQTPSPDGSIDMRMEEKGGVLGDTTYSNQDQNGIVPTYGTPQRNTVTPQRTHTEIVEDNYDDSEVTSSEFPEVDEDSNYVEYTYIFGFNSDARKRYKDGFTYKIDPQTCDSSKFFTSDKYDFSGTISSDDIDKEVEIKVRIKENYIDEGDFDSSDYKLDGKNYTVKGDIQVPQCAD